MTGHFIKGMWVEDPTVPEPPKQPNVRLKDLVPCTIEYQRCDGSIGYMHVIDMRPDKTLIFGWQDMVILP
jgi:hypothetical protein